MRYLKALQKLMLLVVFTLNVVDITRWGLDDSALVSLVTGYGLANGQAWLAVVTIMVLALFVANRIHWLVARHSRSSRSTSIQATQD